MMVNGKIIKNMVMELILDKIMKNMKDIIKMIKNMEKELNIIAIMMCMKEIG